MIPLNQRKLPLIEPKLTTAEQLFLFRMKTYDASSASATIMALEFGLTKRQTIGLLASLVRKGYVFKEEGDFAGSYMLKWLPRRLNYTVPID